MKLPKLKGTMGETKEGRFLNRPIVKVVVRL